MKKTSIVLGGMLLAGGCGSSTGALQVQLEAEDTITSGLAAGTGEEDVVDGWSVDFDRYVIVVGGVMVGNSERHVEQLGTTVIDLAQLPETGHTLALLTELEAGAWPIVRFTTPIATADATRDPSVPEADFDRMVAEGCTYLVAGTITNPAGQRCPRGDAAMCATATSIAFDLCVPAPTQYGPCESDTGIEGVVVAAGTATSVNFTIHGDHLFFNGFPAGAEGSVVRRAQWLADADVDTDGTVTRADLESIGASDLGQLFPSDPGDGMPGYSLGNSPLPITDAWDYVVGELMTQGHFQGEGECPSAAL